MSCAIAVASINVSVILCFSFVSLVGLVFEEFVFLVILGFTFRDKGSAIVFLVGPFVFVVGGTLVPVYLVVVSEVTDVFV